MKVVLESQQKVQTWLVHFLIFQIIDLIMQLKWKVSLNVKNKKKSQILKKAKCSCNSRKQTYIAFFLRKDIIYNRMFYGFKFFSKQQQFFSDLHLVEFKRVAPCKCFPYQRGFFKFSL